MLKVRTKYSPGSCEYDGIFHELRWDLSGCNLRCLFCWSPASRPSETNDAMRLVSPKEVVAETIRNLRGKQHSFIRFTGGEPTLQWNSLLEVFELFRETADYSKPPILIQTNGIEIGKGNVDLAPLSKDQNQLFLFEFSFKGTNKDEFALLTGRPCEDFEDQLNGYRLLKQFAKTNKNVCVVAVLGIYHSSINGPSKYAFVNPETHKILFDDYNNWDPLFTELWEEADFKWVERLRMSPIGVWRNLRERCGSGGGRILKNFPTGVATNTRNKFSSKQKSSDYVKKIVSKQYWR